METKLGSTAGMSPFHVRLQRDEWIVLVDFLVTAAKYLAEARVCFGSWCECSVTLLSAARKQRDEGSAHFLLPIQSWIPGQRMELHSSSYFR